ncbi:DNA-deoxyinosine glycosylase [Marinobacterium rhizophilum]|uniref:DNA-deoxyinosine glycosylase n=1 Tax=Marinobacterium rhizophilum TaxID=420402 RepID=A0ABY5HPG8_9GAMM|nr:DNA-deoxyinosine glycosylase [Marinobacterium rhizophilum]UTW14019.1 DNA-deoxyinosine glycosylase [Marinobacterium rhizophilum]
MSSIQSFNAVSHPDARILILGSVPGVASLVQQQYYAHPRNAFWPIMAQLLGFATDLPYRLRLQQLQKNQIALWDVVHRCQRPGSLDQNIARESVEANDFATFFVQHPQLRGVCFNGGAAETLFKRHVIRAGLELPAGLSLVRLPSTSPANAGLRLEQKLEQWRRAISAPCSTSGAR